MIFKRKKNFGTKLKKKKKNTTKNPNNLKF